MIIVGRKGNQAIQIAEMTVSREHCTISPNGDGSFVVEHKAEGNYTLINGQKIIKKTVSGDDDIQLGPAFKCKVKDLIGNAHIPAPLSPQKPQPQSFSLKEATKVWDDYQRVVAEIKDQNKRVANLRTITPMFTIVGGLLKLLGPIGNKISNPCLAIGLFLMIYAFFIMKKVDNEALLKAAKDEFEMNYICPNPQCRHTLPFQSPKILLHNKCCPYCKSHFTE